MLRLMKPAAFVLAFILALAGCGAASTPGTGDGGANNASSAGTPSTQTPAAETPAGQTPSAQTPAEPETKTVRHELETIEINGVPSKIVILEWSYAESLLALGLQPVGVADIAGYKKWVNAKPELAESVVDVGTRQEPNLEVIASLQPDLIVTTVQRSKASYDNLKAIAPTIVFDPASEEASKDQYAEMLKSFRTMADVLDKNAEAEQVIADLEQLYADAQQKLKEAGKEGASFVLAQAFSNQNAAVLRLFTDNASVSKIYEKLGLQNAFKSDKFEPNAFATASVESLPAVQDAHFLYVVQDDDNVFANQLKDNAVWNGLAFVKENRTYSLGADMWLFGGPLSVQNIVDKTVSLLTESR